MSPSFPRRILQWFVQFNCHISDWQRRVLSRFVPRNSGGLEFANGILPNLLKPGLRVLDVGGGKRPAIDVALKQQLGLHVVGLDIDADELARAPEGAYDEVIVGDIATCALAKEFDLIFSITVMEHVEDTPAALANMANALAEGGVMAHYQPCRYAFFAALNRWLGNRLAKKVLHGIYPPSKATAGFKAYYDRCSPNQFSQICKSHDLEITLLQPYYVSNYCRFFAPAYAIDQLRQVALQWLGISTFCESFTVIAQRPQLQKAARRAAA